MKNRIFNKFYESLEGRMNMGLDFACTFAWAISEKCGNRFYYDEVFENRIRELYDRWEDAIESFDTEIKECPDCGWWCPDVWHETDDVTSGDVCAECHENYTCDECGLIDCECDD